MTSPVSKAEPTRSDVAAGPPFAAILYMAVTTLAATGMLAAALASAGDPGAAFGGRQAEFVLVWVLPIALAARFLAFTLGKVTFSLDTPVFIAAVFHLEPLPVAWAILVTMVIYALWRLIRRIGPYALPEPAYVRALRVLFAPTVTAALGLLFCAAVRDHWTDPAHPAGGFVELAWRVVAVAVAFLLLQYAVVLARYRLEGQGTRHLLMDAALPGFAAELCVLPLTLLFVWSLDRSDPVPFFVLGGSSVVLADIFRRFVRARARAFATIEELERLVTTGEKVFAVLGHQQVLRALVHAIAAEIPGARRALAGIWDDDVEGQPQRCMITALTASGQLEEDAGSEPLQEALRERLQIDRPATFTVQGPDGPWTAMTVPFSVDGTAEGFIGVDLGSEPSAGGATARRHRALEQAREVLRRLASIAGIAIHNARLYRLATIDGLTGLYVRRFFERRYAEEVARCRRHAGTVSVLLIDLDDFKLVNDGYGHAAGDEVLRGVARSLQEALRLTDVPCRYGGDEFVVLLPDATVSDAMATAVRLSRLVAAQVFSFPGGDVSITASIGVAGSSCSSGGESVDLVSLADVALYRSKETLGKGRVILATEADAAQI